MIKNLLGIIIVLFSVQSFAQKTDSSPYSSLGIGNEATQKTVREMSMGGVGTASNTFQLNFSNPASYAALVLTTYTLAGENRAYWFKDANASDNSSNAYLSYLGMGIPLGEKAGFAFGLQLNSTVGYHITEREFDATDELIKAAIYEGNGGTNRVFFGFGYELFKNFSAGLEAKYVFGKGENTVINQVRDVELATKYYADAKVNGFGFKAGLLYHKDLGGNLFINLGTAIEFESNLDAKGNAYLYSVSVANLNTPKDTILNVESNGIYKTPLKTNLGISIGDSNKWEVNVDYSFRKAIELEGSLLASNSKLKYQNASKFSVGGFYIPKFNSISSYWHRVSYRAGIRMEKTGLMFDGLSTGTEFTPVDDFGISFGLGLPLGNRYSKLDASFEYGKKGTVENGLTQENYFNFRIGLQFSAKWFNKNEIN